MEERYIITNDGEIVDKISEGDRIVRANSVEKFNDTIEINKSDNFIKVYTKCLFEISSEITGAESVLLMFLLQYLQYQTGILTHSNGALLTREYIMSDTKQSQRTIDRSLEGLIKKRILGKHRTGKTVCFTVNPFIFMKGNRVNKTLAKFFENSKWNK